MRTILKKIYFTRTNVIVFKLTPPTLVNSLFAIRTDKKRIVLPDNRRKYIIRIPAMFYRSIIKKGFSL